MLCGVVDPDSLLISILHLIRLLLILKVSLPQTCRKRQRVADTKAKIGGKGGRTNPIRCEGDPSRRKYTSNADEGHMVRAPEVEEELGSQVAGLTGCRNAVGDAKSTRRWFTTGRRIHFITLYAQHNHLRFIITFLIFLFITGERFRRKIFDLVSACPALTRIRN